MTSARDNMAATSRVGAARSGSGRSVPTRVPLEAGYAPGFEVDEIMETDATEFPSRWRQGGGSGYGRDGAGGQHAQGRPMFTPLVGRLAVAFSAHGPSDGTTFVALVIGDIQRGVGRYEFNMRLFAGAYAVQGSVINRIT